MTKPFESHREEIVRLYISEGKTLEVVMDMMRSRHQFNASLFFLELSRRSYMENLKRWGIRKNRRKDVVLSQPADASSEEGANGRRSHRQHSSSSSSAAAAAEDELGHSSNQQHGVQSLVLQYHQQSHQDPAQEQQQAYAPAYNWGYFAHSRWPVDQTSTGSPFARHRVDGHQPPSVLGSPSPGRARRLNASADSHDAAPASRLVENNPIPAGNSREEPVYEPGQSSQWTHSYTMP
ncbi:hypothetical protein XA68_16556 [Ophiocordyceps unilateralis]|uniref:Clr5 domain-containing protein n=1 Tax=Ophiocordyceps unilateralis TaxID=268505 RepID=A0A2A9P6E2_OPHUN|nr:hypothetical protein XA68_16556 [Ophiocordyceps unilateralis]